MFGFGASSGKPHYGALIDVGSESVGIAVVSSKMDEAYPKILFSHRVHMRITAQEVSATERIRYMKEALFSASLILSRDGLEALRVADTSARLQDILLTVSAPWSHTISKSVVYAGETDLKISRALIDELVTSAEEDIRTSIANESPELTEGFSVIERATTDVRINDYHVDQPIGLRGKEISLVHVTGLMPIDITKAVEDIRDKILPNVSIRSHTFLLVLYCVIREHIEDHSSLTIVHVTGETTEFGIVENNTLTENISVPFGLNGVVRELMRGNERTANEIHSLLTLSMHDELAEKEKSEVEKVLSAYSKRVGEALKNHAPEHRFPKNAFILAPTSFTQLFKHVLTPILRDEIGVGSEPLTFPREHLDSSPTHDEQDDHIAIAASFFHKLHGCGEMSSI